MPIPQQRDRGQARQALTSWLARQLPGATDVRLSEIEGPGFTGFSSETLLFDAHWREGAAEHGDRFVARVEPTGHTVFPDTMFAEQWEVMSALAARTNVLVPPPRWFEPDPIVLGAPFLVMTRVDGEPPADNPPYPIEGWLLDAPPDAQASVWWTGLEAMAAVHQVDWRTLEVDFTGPGARYLVGLDQQLAYYERYLTDTAHGRLQPTVEAGMAWLRDHQPAEDTPELCWGDSRLGNILFRKYRAAAVLDWEMVCLGDPQQDLAWFLYFDRHHTEALGQQRLPGLPAYDDTVARWEALTGRSADQLEYYTVFAGVRFGVVMLRLAQIMIGYDILDLDSDYERNNTATQFLDVVLAEVGAETG